VNDQRTIVLAGCQWTLEHNGPVGSVGFYSPQIGRTDYANAQIKTYDGVSGTCYKGPEEKLYVLSMWTSGGTSGSYFSQERAWICGGYFGSKSASASGLGFEVFYYPIGCNRQADDSGSWFYANDTGNYYYPYTTQG
jgi:hypothetical protein